jgi:hypothetical protein
VDKGIDALIAWVVGMAKKLFAKAFSKNPDDKRTDAQKKSDLHKGVMEADALLANDKLTADEVGTKLPAIQKKYKLTTLALVTDAKTDEEETDHIEGSVNPVEKAATRKKTGKDGVTKIEVKRSSFTVTTKWTLREKFDDQHKKDVKGRGPRLQKNLDRRHVVSSQTMAAHYEAVLNGQKWSAATSLLEKKNETLPQRLGNKNIQKAAQSRHARFFNDIKNLFIDDASENRSIGAATDIPDDWTDREWKKHLKYVKTTYALSEAFTA